MAPQAPKAPATNGSTSAPAAARAAAITSERNDRSPVAPHDSTTLLELLAQVQSDSLAAQYLLLWGECSSRASKAECRSSPSLPAGLQADAAANATVAAYKSMDTGLASPVGLSAGSSGSSRVGIGGANLVIVIAVVLGTVWAIIFGMVRKSRRRREGSG
jgi:hypothetical protein